MNLAERIQAVARQDPSLPSPVMSTAPFVVESTESLAWFRGRTVSIAFQAQDAEYSNQRGMSLGPGYQQDSEQRRFDRAINELRIERRTRLSVGGPSRYSGRGCFSVRCLIEKPTNGKPQPLETRPEKFDGPVIPIWHQPDHLIFTKNPGETERQFEERVYAKPRYAGEYVVMLGDRLVPATEIHSQGENRVSVRGEEVVVTDFWAVEYTSGWRGFVDARIRLRNGDRKRDEFFEPTKQQMSSWREKYTNMGEFKKKTHPRFRRTLHKWLFSNQTDEAPSISQGFHPKELEYDFSDVYEDGAYVESETEQPEDAEQVGQVTKPKPGQAWCDDPNFVDDLNAMLPKGYSKLLAYQSGYSLPLPDDLRLAPARDLDESTYAVVPVAVLPCSTYLVPKTELQPLRPSTVGVDSSSDQGLVESKRRTLMLGSLEQITIAEQKQCEAILRSAADYDPRQHRTLGHFYEYDYRYYPGEISPGDGVFHTVKNTTRTKKNLDPLKRIVVGWDDAIRNTFGRATEPPPDGFYMLYKMKQNTPTRVYPLLTRTLVFNGHESPAPFGLDDIHEEIRTSVSKIRTKLQPATIRRNLGKIALTGDRSVVTHVRFCWNNGKLTWVLGDTSTAPISSVES